jgi:hypothetical protein
MELRPASLMFAAEQKGRGLLVVDVLNMYSDDLFVRTERLYRVDITVPSERLLRAGDILFVRSSVKESGVGWPAIFKRSVFRRRSFKGFGQLHSCTIRIVKVAFIALWRMLRCRTDSLNQAR